MNDTEFAKLPRSFDGYATLAISVLAGALLALLFDLNITLAALAVAWPAYHLVRLGLRPLLLAVPRWRRSRRRCPHRVIGGATQRRCPTCRASIEREAQAQKAELVAAEQRIATGLRAEELRVAEITRLRRARLRNLKSLASLNPYRFEDEVAQLFRAMGYTVEQTPYANDRGRDAVATRDGRTYLIECKCYHPGRAIGRRDLQIFYAAMVEAQAYGGFFVTTARCKDTAIDFVEGKAIELVDGEALVRLISSTYPADPRESVFSVMCPECGDVSERVLDPAAGPIVCGRGHPITETITPAALTGFAESSPGSRMCPRCGGQLRRVKGRNGSFLGCTAYPACRFTRPMRHRRGPKW